MALCLYFTLLRYVAKSRYYHFATMVAKERDVPELARDIKEYWLRIDTGCGGGGRELVGMVEVEPW